MGELRLHGGGLGGFGGGGGAGFEMGFVEGVDEAPVGRARREGGGDAVAFEAEEGSDGGGWVLGHGATPRFSWSMMIIVFICGKGVGRYG